MPTRDAFGRRLEEFCEKAEGTVCVSFEDTDRQIEESFAQINLLAWGLILFVGLIGILNIINTVSTNIHTRKAEIGMQRAVGMSISSLYRTFLCGKGRITESFRRSSERQPVISAPF